MERITNEDIIKAEGRKSVAQARDTLSKIGKDDKIDTDKMKMRPDTSKKNLAAAYRLRMGLPESMSDDEVIKRFQNQGVPKNKKGAAKLPKKSIMEIPTNVPRLMKGALLGDLNKDGKMSGYETARQKAIEKSMKEQKAKKAKSGLAVGIEKIKKAKQGVLMSDRDKQLQEKNKIQALNMKDKIFDNSRLSDQDVKMLNNIFNKNKISDQDMKTLKRFIK